MGFGPGFDPGYQGGAPALDPLLEEGLYEYLTANAPLAGGWHPLRVPDGAPLPAGTYARISAPRTQAHSGSIRLAMRRFQMTVYSERYREGRLAAVDVRALLDNRRWTFTGGVASSTIVGDGEDIDPEPRGLFRQMVDAFVNSEAL